MNDIPMWVYVLFFVLLNLGVKRCYTRVTAVGRIALLPIVFTVMSLYSAQSLFVFTPSLWFSWGVFVLAGSLLGYGYVNKRIIRADKTKHLIEIPGDISMLILLMSIFFIEFFIHYAIAAHKPIAQFSEFKFISIALTSLIVGLSIGRNLNYFKKYHEAPTVELFEAK